MIIVPGGFLVVTLMAMTEVGQFLQKELNQKESNLFDNMGALEATMGIAGGKPSELR